MWNLRVLKLLKEKKISNFSRYWNKNKQNKDKNKKHERGDEAKLKRARGCVYTHTSSDTRIHQTIFFRNSAGINLTDCVKKLSKATY